MRDLAAEPAKHDHWYHTIELPGGYSTPGLYDMPRALRHVAMPHSLRGKRCLDIGTSDGFWAFEMERRGASEVVGLDLGGWDLLDWPPACGSTTPDTTTRISTRFELAREALGSSVKWTPGSIYDLSPERLGHFDFVFLGSMLVHLRDPVRALAAVRSVTRGELLLNEVVSISLSLVGPRWPAARLIGLHQPTWWIPNVAALRRFVEVAGFKVLGTGNPYYLRFGAGRRTADEQTLTPVTLRPLRRLPLQAFRNLKDRLGIPHAWLLASPRPELANGPSHRSAEAACGEPLPGAPRRSP